MTCSGSDCSASAVMGTLRTPGQAIFQLGATGAAVAAGCVSVCAPDAGTSADDAMMLSKAKLNVIDLRTEAPSGFRWKNSTSPLRESSARRVCVSIERANRFWWFVGQPSARWSTLLAWGGGRRVVTCRGWESGVKQSYPECTLTAKHGCVRV